MKNIIFILFLFFNISLLAQIPVVPELCLVTVDNDSLVKLKWNYTDTTTVKGFIIKRKIFGGNGVVDGTFNNIEILANTILEYKDISSAYSTKAKPYKRTEEYVIAAYLKRNDSIIFSNLTLSQQTIFFDAQWNECTQKSIFSWNKYKNRDALKYRLLYSTDNINFNLLKEFSSTETNYSTSSLLLNTNYYFKIEAVLKAKGACLSDTSVSNLDNLYTYSPIVPNELTVVSASVVDNNHIEINYFMNGGTGIEKIILVKNNDKQIAEFNGNNNADFYIDNESVYQSNCYKLKALDSCGNILKESKDVCNIFLQVVQKNKSFDFTFSSTTINEEIPDNYSIFIDIGKGWQEIKQLSNTMNKINILLSEIFINTEYNGLYEIGFKIKASKNNIESFSNSVYLPLESIISVPNAFNPKSNIEQDRFFTIKGMFIEQFNLIIFTENNEIIFQSSDIKNRWNGYINNSILAEKGAYIYQIKYKGKEGNWKKKRGIINLVY